MCEWKPNADFKRLQPQRYEQMYGVKSPVANDPTRAKLAPTGADIEGPFYRPDSPAGDALCDSSEPGDKFVLTGKVLGTDGKPVKGAKVDVWQADRDGHYDIDDPAQALDPAHPYKFRAHQVTGEDGSFKFSTIRPGHYQIGENRWRTGHIHVKVSDQAHQPLTTQLYFETDHMNPGNTTSPDLNETDSWFDPKRVLDMAPGANQWPTARFDIVLANR